MTLLLIVIGAVVILALLNLAFVLNQQSVIDHLRAQNQLMLAHIRRQIAAKSSSERG